MCRQRRCGDCVGEFHKCSDFSADLGREVGGRGIQATEEEVV